MFIYFMVLCALTEANLLVNKTPADLKVINMKKLVFISVISYFYNKISGTIVSIA